MKHKRGEKNIRGESRKIRNIGYVGVRRWYRKKRKRIYLEESNKS